MIDRRLIMPIPDRGGLTIAAVAPPPVERCVVPSPAALRTLTAGVTRADLEHTETGNGEPPHNI